MTMKYDLPEHSELRVKANYHFIDQWQGSTGFLKVRNESQDQFM
jgi:hypothetical protein